MEGNPRTKVNPSLEDCYKLMWKVEDEYNVAINFWLAVQRPSHGRLECWLYAAGAGDLFDSLPSDKGIARSLILQAQNNSIAAPMWAVVAQLESNLYQAKSLRTATTLP